MESFEDLIGQVDAVFVVDTTGSMGPFIAAARQHIRRIAEEIAHAGALDLRFAVVEYRDHPPQDRSFAARAYAFGDGDALQVALERLQPDGGGDAPEAVLDGLIEAARLQWRPEADKLCYLVGDAPPHGSGASSDAWPEGCPCRATPNGVVELLGGRDIKLHAITLTPNPVLVRAFRELAEGTGGTLTEAPADPRRAAIATAAPLALTSELVETGRAYMAAAATAGSFEPDAVAPVMGVPKEVAEGTAVYLRRRGLFRRKG